MSFEVVVLDEAGTYWPLSRYGALSGISYTTGWGNGQPGGCQGASWVLDTLTPADPPPVLRKGREVIVFDGPAPVWRGKVSSCEAGQYHAEGLAVEANFYGCYSDAVGTPTSVPLTAVTEALSRGLPWTAASTTGLSPDPFSANDETAEINSVRDLLDAYAEANGLRWAVWSAGELEMAADPVSPPTWLVRGQDPLLPVGDDDFITHLFGRYVATISPTTYGTVVVGDDDLRVRHGRRKEAPFDLTPLGLMAPADASSLVTERLRAVSARSGFTSGFTVTSDQMFSPGGIQARLSLVRAGEMVRVWGVLDAGGHLALGGVVDLVIGETQYDVDSDVLQISPVGMSNRSTRDLLTVTAPPSRVETVAFAEGA